MAKLNIKLIGILSRLYFFINNNNNIISLFFNEINDEFGINISTSWDTSGGLLGNGDNINTFISRIMDNLDDDQKSDLITYLTI